MLPDTHRRKRARAGCAVLLIWPATCGEDESPVELTAQPRHGWPLGRRKTLSSKRNRRLRRPGEMMRVRPAFRFLPVLFVLAPLCAQDSFPHHNFTFGAGGASPQSELSHFMQSAPGVSVGYGYRFMRYFQADAGLDILFGAARIRDFLTTDIGGFRIKDREYFIPLGGRAIAPLAGGKLLLSAGGGGAWMKYSERVNQPSSYYRIDCPICTSRSGWGYYAQVGGDWFFGRNLRLGVMSRFYRGHTEGEPLGPVPGVRTTDHWINTLAEIGFSF